MSFLAKSKQVAVCLQGCSANFRPPDIGFQYDSICKMSLTSQEEKRTDFFPQTFNMQMVFGYFCSNFFHK